MKKPNVETLWDFKKALEWKLSEECGIYGKLGIVLALGESIDGFRQISGVASLFKASIQTCFTELFKTPLMTKDGSSMAVRDEDLDLRLVPDRTVFLDDLPRGTQLWLLAFIWDSGVVWQKSRTVVLSPEELVLEWALANGKKEKKRDVSGIGKTEAEA